MAKKLLEVASDILALMEENRDDEGPAVKAVAKFIKKYGLVCLKKLTKHPADPLWNEMRFALLEAAVFNTDFFLLLNVPDARAFEAAMLGNSLGSAHCMLALSYMYAKGVCGLTFNSKAAREYIEKAVHAGGVKDGNFEVVKDAVIDAQERAALIHQAAVAGAKRSGEFLELALGLSEWLSDYTSCEKSPEPVEGSVFLEKTVTGDNYVFYDKEDYGKTHGERMKNYDPLMGKGETESGAEIKNK